MVHDVQVADLGNENHSCTDPYYYIFFEVPVFNLGKEYEEKEQGDDGCGDYEPSLCYFLIVDIVVCILGKERCTWNPGLKILVELY